MAYTYTRYRSIDFGPTRTGLTTVGYTILNGADGTTLVARTQAGVIEEKVGGSLGQVGTTSTGGYGANITTPGGTRGTLIWDSGEATPVYGRQSINPEEDETLFDNQSRVADPGGIAAMLTPLHYLIALWRRNYKRVTLTNTQLTTYADNNTSVNVTQTVSDDGLTQTQGPGA